MNNTIYTVPSAGNMEMLWVDAGELEVDEKIVIKNGFYLGKYEVTQEQYAMVRSNSRKKNPSQVKGNNLPVDSVDHSDARAFIARLNYLEKSRGYLIDGWAYSLPTYSELEFACRAGTTTKYFWGDELSDTFAGQMSSYYPGNKNPYLYEVGSYLPNPWGFHDLIGNAGEWTKSRLIFGYPFDLDRKKCLRDTKLKNFITPITRLNVPFPGGPVTQTKIGEYNKYPGYSGLRVILKKIK